MWIGFLCDSDDIWEDSRDSPSTDVPKVSEKHSDISKQLWMVSPYDPLLAGLSRGLDFIVRVCNNQFIPRDTLLIKSGQFWSCGGVARFPHNIVLFLLKHTWFNISNFCFCVASTQWSTCTWHVGHSRQRSLLRTSSEMYLCGADHSNCDWSTEHCIY